MKNVIFDLGDVLIKWDPALAFADDFPTREAAEEWIARIDFDDWNRIQDGGRSLADGLAAVRDAFGEAAAKPLESYPATFPLTIQEPNRETWAIAEALVARDIPLYAITNWSAPNWPAALEVHPRLPVIFRDIVVSGHVDMLKPEPRIYQLLLDRNNLRAEDCIFIDDRPLNVEGAKALGMDGIHFTDAAALSDALKQRGLFDWYDLASGWSLGADQRGDVP